MGNAAEISIRKCTPGDEQTLALLGQATFLEAFAGTLPGSDILGHCTKQHSGEKYAAWLSDPESIVWIAEAPGGAPVGYLVLTRPDLPVSDLSDADVEVKRVYLLHRFQGGGLGRRLMLQARSEALARGKRRLLLGVYEGNHAAIAFYEKLGYRRVGERMFHVGNNTYHDAVMALDVV